MRPVLFELPSKALFFALLAVGTIALTQGASAKARRPGAWSSAVVPLACAWLVLGICGRAFVPSTGVFARAWPALPVFSYAVMLWTSLVVGWFVTMRLGRADGLAAADVAALYTWTAVASIIGARALYVLTNPGDFPSIADVLALWRGGLVAYGGMIGGFVATVWVARRRGVTLLRWADAAAPAVALGTAITRVGCLLFGCDYGAPTDVPWAIRFPVRSPAWLHHREHLGLPADAERSFPVHPTQIYELVAGLAIFCGLLWIRRRRRVPGKVFAGWVIGYGLLRPLIELFRGDPERGSVGPLSTSQLIGLLSVLGAGVLLWRLNRAPPLQLQAHGRFHPGSTASAPPSCGGGVPDE
ncbi:MAG: prolipoprotein diacylglyceryl transferase [Myxococcaceae bacterium]|nr:prolipoprotein diacylglyceryl transferase [Myxococcaceae bacterium]